MPKRAEPARHSTIQSASVDPIAPAAQPPRGAQVSAKNTKASPQGMGTPPVNRPPVALGDSYSVLHDTELTIGAPGLLQNDSDPDGDELTAFAVTQPAHGEVLFQNLAVPGDGSLRYLPNEGFVGMDSFTYAVTDGTLASQPATIAIQVFNHAPQAQPETFSVGEDAVLSGSVLANDSDPDNDPLTAVLVNSAPNGEFQFHTDGSFTFASDPNFYGTTTFTYYVTDGPASTGPITATILVSRNLFDLDGRDITTQTNWNYEWEEGSFNQTRGLWVDTGSASQILIRDTTHSDWVRTVNWDPTVFAVNGITDPGHIVMGGTGDVIFDVTKVRDYGESQINLVITGLDPGGENFAAIVPLHATQVKTELFALDFTSDHGLLCNNNTNVLLGGSRYPDVEFQPNKVNAPITHNWDSNVTLTATFTAAGINAPVKLVGTSNLQGLNFQSEVANAAPVMKLNLTSTDKLPKQIQGLDGTITWTLVANPGQANAVTYQLGASGNHRIYTTFATPRDTNNPESKVTDIRVQRAVDLGNTGYTNALQHVPPGTTPTFNRIVYEMVQRQVFNVDRNVTTDPAAGRAGPWRVPDTWALNPPGCDCVSGARFVMLAAKMLGVPGTIEAQTLRPESPANPKKAVNGRSLAQETRMVGDIQQIQGLSDRSQTYNSFEATVYYNNGQIRYFPVGAGPTWYDDANKVLSIFSDYGWFKPENQKFVLVQPSIQSWPAQEANSPASPD